MEFDVDPLVAVLVAGEVGFWMLLGAGLVARYLLRRRTAGAVLLVRWADQRFAHRFAGGPPPWRPPRSGRARVRYEWREWARYALAWVIACAVLLGLAGTAAPRHRGTAGPIRGGLTAVGRTALSCYVLQNVVAGVLCYGWGLGLATRFADARPWWVVGAWAGISVLNVALASWWLHRFDRGPLELLWHWAYRTPQPRRGMTSSVVVR